VSNPTNGGAAQSSFTPLAGGCAGGDVLSPGGVSLVKHGGGGGGALQIVSAVSVAFIDDGLVDAGGGGGSLATGGGAGGTVIIEAPTVSMAGPSAGVVANGGSGAGCTQDGVDATSNNNVAVAPSGCPVYFGGNGGTANAYPGDACVYPGANCPMPQELICPMYYGGGGGSVGRMRAVTLSGGVDMTNSALRSVGLYTDKLTVE